MLYRFCLLRLTAIFLLVSALITGILCVGYLFDKSSIFIPLGFLPAFLLATLPPIAVYSVPLCLAISILGLFYWLAITGEYDLIVQYETARNTIKYAIVSFTCLIIALYLPLVMVWAPQSYEVSKKLILSLAQHKLSALEAGIIHRPFPGLSVCCDELTHREQLIQFKNLMLTSTDKKENVIIFRANHAELNGQLLLFQDGFVVFGHNKIWQRVNFKTLKAPLTVLTTEPIKAWKKQPKWRAAAQLVTQRTPDDLFELSKRISLIFWLMLIAAACLQIGMCNPRRLTVPVNLAIAGGLFFALYATQLGAQSFRSKLPFLAIAILFLLPVAGILVVLGRKK